MCAQFYIREYVFVELIEKLHSNRFHLKLQKLYFQINSKIKESNRKTENKTLLGTEKTNINQIKLITAYTKHTTKAINITFERKFRKIKKQKIITMYSNLFPPWD